MIRILLLDADPNWCKAIPKALRGELDNCEIEVFNDSHTALSYAREVRDIHLVIVSQNLSNDGYDDLEGHSFLRDIAQPCPSALKVLIVSRQIDTEQTARNLVDRCAISRVFLRIKEDFNTLNFTESALVPCNEQEKGLQYIPYRVNSKR